MKRLEELTYGWTNAELLAYCLAAAFCMLCLPFVAAAALDFLMLN